MRYLNKFFFSFPSPTGESTLEVESEPSKRSVPLCMQPCYSSSIRGGTIFLPITKKNGMKLLKDVGSLLYDYVGVAVYYNWYIFNKNYIYYELIKCHTTHNG